MTNMDDLPPTDVFDVSSTNVSPDDTPDPLFDEEGFTPNEPTDETVVTLEETPQYEPVKVDEVTFDVENVKEVVIVTENNGQPVDNKVSTRVMCIPKMSCLQNDEHNSFALIGI